MPYMRRFSDDEFEKMIFEITSQDHPNFSMLCEIASKQVWPYIRRKCSQCEAIRRRNAEDDVMQEVHCRLIKTCVTGFFLRDGRDEINRDPEEFCKWMYTVAKHVFCDYANRISIIDSKTRPIEEGEDIPSPLQPVFEHSQEEAQDTLRNAFAIVIASDNSVYKILTWMAQCVVVLRADTTKLRSNGILISEFSEKTLYEMRDTIIDAAKEIPWLLFTEDQLSQINTALDKRYDDARRFGEVPYKMFFMKKGGKSSISDWVNRMNVIIVRRMKNGPSVD